MKIALVGAGGKMGRRLSVKLTTSRHEVFFVETGSAGIAYLQEQRLTVTPIEDAAKHADAIILAIPDVAIGKVSGEIVPLMKAGAMLITLDPAAAYSGKLPERKDISYFIAHPCHTSMFNDEVTEEARKDYFGGVAAKQNIVCALMQGPEADYAVGEEIAKIIYAPILRSHRITVEQMAILEPGLSETVSGDAERGHGRGRPQGRSL
jgi:prephenate dehydrogenase